MIAAALLAAAFAAGTRQPILEAPIEIADPAPVYRVRLDDAMTAAIGMSPGIARVDVIDADGRTMPRGMLSPALPQPPPADPADKPLTLSPPETRDVVPPACRRDPDGDGCSFYEPPRNVLPPGVGVFNPGAGIGSSRAMGGALGGARGGPGVSVANDDFNRVPLAFSVVTTDLPPESVDWTKPTLVLRWKSKLAPREITWQIGRNVARVTDADRAQLATSQYGKGMPALRNAWWHGGRFELFGHGKTVAIGDGEWEASVPIDWSTAAAPLEIGSAPPDAVRGLSARVQTTRATRVNERTRRAMTLTPSGEGAWRIEGTWPATTEGVDLEVDAKQALTARDAGIERIAYTLRSASGTEQVMTLWPTVRTTGASRPKEETWDELRASGMPDGFGAPALFARYRAADIWFENRGTPPYRIRVGPLSERISDQLSPASVPRVMGRDGGAPDAPWARIGPVRVAGEVADPRPPQDIEKDRDRRGVFIAAGAATLLVALLAMLDLALARRLAARETRR